MFRSLQRLWSGSSALLRVTFYDQDSQPAAPTALTYRIIEPAAASEIRAATALTPAAVVDITLHPADNTLSDGYCQERRRVIIEATYGVEDVLIEVYEYIILAPDTTA